MALALALLMWLVPPADDAAEASNPRGRVRVAKGVCDAQRLKAAKEEDPRLQIELPPETDKQFPTLEACLAHDEAWNDDLPGPRQPIPFSHKHHSAAMSMDCLYCHSGSDRSRAAGVPSVAGTQCQECHGPAEELDRLYVVPAASWQYFVPVAKLQMGWCVQCHDKTKASKDCLLCHY